TAAVDCSWSLTSRTSALGCCVPAVASSSGQVDLPGRPRWCAYDANGDPLLGNIREPACVAAATGEPPRLVDRWAVSQGVPLGLDLDLAGGRAFVASDGGAVSVLDLSTGREAACVPISGEPDAVWYNRSGTCSTCPSGSPAWWTS